MSGLVYFVFAILIGLAWPLKTQPVLFSVFSLVCILQALYYGRTDALPADKRRARLSALVGVAAVLASAAVVTLATYFIDVGGVGSHALLLTVTLRLQGGRASPGQSMCQGIHRPR